MRRYITSAFVGITLGAAFILPTAAFAQGTASDEAQAENNGDVIIVTGTRQQAQTQFGALSPVDVFSQRQLQSTVTSNVDQTLATLVPSFNVKHLPSSDGPQFIRPASLNGLTPDMTLVLVNGKRFHRSAFLQGNGSQATDLGQIPAFNTGHIEVLRDGASAQYGSDAIAGVINILFDTKPGFSAYSQGSRYYAGDGTGWQVGARAGLALGDGGHLVIASEYAHSEATSRTVQRPDAIAFQAAHPTIAVPNPVQNWGSPRTKSFRLAMDAALPLQGSMEAYTFGTYARSRGISDINWRNPDTTTSVYKIVTVFPGFDLRTIYPAGFAPREGVRANDGQIVGGIRDKGSDRFTWDLSASFGVNSSQFFLNNSINASMGPKSPRNFILGRLVQREFNLNADGVYRLPVAGLADPVNIAFGVERRVEAYQIIKGDPASYEVGPGANEGLAAQSNGFPGFGPQQAGTFTQTDYAGYLDVQVPVTSKWNVQAAIRDEHYNTFGNTFNFKLATRYEITPALAIRGGYSTGFKAPSPGQLNSTNISQGLDTNTLQLFTNGRLSPLNPVAQFFGAKALKPQESKTATAGLVWRSPMGLSGSIDAYQIDVSKRFSISPTFTVTPAIRTQLVNQGVAGASDFTNVNFFTNDFDTRTRGIDAVLSYLTHAGAGQLNATVAYSYTHTKVTSGSLAAASSLSQRTIFEQGIPQHNASGTVTYDIGKLSLLGRVRYYGPWTDSSGNTSGDIFQRFGGISFVDVSLTYKLSDQVSMRVGAENLFDTYPEKALFQASRGLVYSRNAPYGVNGGSYYARVDFKF
jgi:iron complex outermembrane recepter protein